MKKMMTLAFALTIAAALATGFTACTKDDDVVDTPDLSMVPTGVQITVSAGFADDATTRSAVTTDGTKHTLKFTAGDQLYVYGMIADGDPAVYTTLAGYLDIDATSISTDGKSASFTGTLNTYQSNGSGLQTVVYNFGSDNPLERCNYDAATAYLIHSGMKADVYEISDNSKDFTYDMEKMFAADVETLMTTCLLVSGDYSGGSFALNSSSPILNCTFGGLTASHDYTATLTTGENSSEPYNFTTNASGIGTIAIVTSSGEKARTITIKDGSTMVCTIDLGTRNLGAKVYNVSRRLVNLASITSDYTAQNGDVLSGTLDGTTQKYKISIADGATVMLSGATINGKDTDDTHELWAGLTCLGDATLILDGTNAVENFNRYYPGLQPGPAGTTLTIRGSGSLTATGRNFGTGIGTKNDGGSCGNIRIEGGTVTANGGEGAGIGSGYNSSCGDITITGGTVTATGGYDGAGIGSGNVNNGTSKCGDITITGGTVTATGGGSGAGIGSGNGNGGTSQCGAISISGSASVTATGGGNGAGIGTGQRGKCGSISISGGTVMAKGGNNATGIGTGEGDYDNKAECGAISISKGEGFVSVTAIRGSDASMSIGTRNGKNNDSHKCGSITFGSEKIFNGGENEKYGEPEDRTYDDLQFTKSTTDDDDPGTDDTNNTWTLKPCE